MAEVNEDYTQNLGMNTLFNNYTNYIDNPVANILYAESIDLASVKTIYDTITDLVGEGKACNNFTSTYTEMDSLHSATDSNFFYNGTDASAQWSALSGLNTKIEELATVLSSQDWETIESKINEYNEKLSELKTNARLQMLLNKANAWNKAKHVKEGYPIQCVAQYAPGPSTTWFTSEEETVVYGEAKNVKATEMSSYEGVMISAEEYDWYEYKIIKTWSGFKSIKIFNDPGFAEIEQKFEEVGCSLPYDPLLIKD